jgi:hypothetical protein
MCGCLFSIDNPTLETDIILKCIYKFLNNAEDLSIERRCALLNTVDEELEVNTENLPEYFSAIEDSCMSRNGASIVVKQNLQAMNKLRQQKRIQGKRQDLNNNYTQNEAKKIHVLSSNIMISCGFGDRTCSLLLDVSTEVEENLLLVAAT